MQFAQFLLNTQWKGLRFKINDFYEILTQIHYSLVLKVSILIDLTTTCQEITLDPVSVRSKAMFQNIWDIYVKFKNTVREFVWEESSKPQRPEFLCGSGWLSVCNNSKRESYTQNFQDGSVIILHLTESCDNGVLKLETNVMVQKHQKKQILQAKRKGKWSQHYKDCLKVSVWQKYTEKSL